MSSRGGRIYSSAYLPLEGERQLQVGLRALEGIKDKLQPLSERSDTTEHAEREADMITVCDLADDLRDAIIEYQVSTEIEKYMRVGPLIQRIGRAAEGDLQAEL